MSTTGGYTQPKRAKARKPRAFKINGRMVAEPWVNSRGKRGIWIDGPPDMYGHNIIRFMLWMTAAAAWCADAKEPRR